MKRNKLTLLVLMLIAFLSHGCIKDFDEGANFSFRSVEGRIHGSWRLQQVIINGIDSTEIPPYSQYYGHGIVTFTLTSTDKEYYVIEASFPNSTVPNSIGRWKYNGGNTLDTYFQPIGFYTKQITIALTLEKIICCRYNKLVLEDTYGTIKHRTVLVR